MANRGKKNRGRVAVVARPAPAADVRADGAPIVSPWARRVLLVVTLVGSFSLVAADLGWWHYGSTQDEFAYFGATRRHMAWLGMAGQPGALSPDVLKEHFEWHSEIVIHPTFSRWCSGVTWLSYYKWWGGDEIVALRLHNAIAFALIAWAIVGYLLPRYGMTTAVVGLLLTWGDVRLFGHTHSGQTDLVLSCVWLWAVLLAVRGVYEGSTWSLVGAAIVAGFALSTKLTGLLLVGLLVAWPIWAHGRRGWKMSAVFLLVPPLVFYVLNPPSWHHPIDWTVHWLAEFKAREKSVLIPIMFMGTDYEFRSPWYSAPVHALITIPPAIWLLAAVAAWNAALRMWREGWRERWAEARSAWALCTVAGAVPLAAVCMPGVPNHDVERLFLPMQPLLILGAGYGFAVLVRHEWLRRFSAWRPAWPTWAPATALAAVFTVPTVVVAASFHPYELTYFNFLVGGPRGAQRLGFDLAYIKQEVNWQVLNELNQRLPPNAELWSNFMFNELATYQFADVLRPDIKLAKQYPCTYILIHGRRGWMQPYERTMMDHPEWAIWKVMNHGAIVVGLFQVEVIGKNKDGFPRVRIRHGTGNMPGVEVKPTEVGVVGESKGNK